VSDWGYVTIAFTVVWGSLAVYAIVMARRVTQAQQVTARLRGALGDPAHNSGAISPSRSSTADEQDSPLCEAPPES
jgi:hypothetical protein